MAIDKTKRPLRVPPQFQLYAEEHGLFDLYHRMLQRLVIDKPSDPLTYMIDWFKRESDPVPKISVIGAPGSGKHSVAEKLSQKLGAVLVKASPHAHTDEEIINELTDRLRAPGSEPVRRGFILEDLPKTRKQSLLLQQAGISQKHIISLEAPEAICLGRRMGKHINEKTGEVFHNIFNWPDNLEIRKNLTPAKNANKEIFENENREWNRECIGIFDAYKETKNVVHVNADQPLADVLSHCIRIAKQPNRSEAVVIPRLILLGPLGAGKSTIAEYLCGKYKIVNVDASACLNIMAKDKGSSTGDAIRQFLEENNIDTNADNLFDVNSDIDLPDELYVRCVIERLSRMDCQTKGWLLYNFPKNAAQAESLNLAGHRPNKVLSLELPLEAAVERLKNRRTDPETGMQYHLLWNAPQSTEIADRLVSAPYDNEAVISIAHEKYTQTIKWITRTYIDLEKQLEKTIGGIYASINADQDYNTVLEYAESMLINPVPHNESQS